MKPERKNYVKTLELTNDLSVLTGLDKSVIKTVLKGMSLVLVHYIAEDSLDSKGKCAESVVEIPFIGSMSLNYEEGRPSTKLFNFDISVTDTFYTYLVDACREGKSPVDEAVVRKFVDVFIDKYKNVI